MIDFKSRLREINENINNAAVKSGRNFSDISMIAVTKTVNADIINAAYEFGVKEIGENKVQELLGKLDQLNKNFIIHFIGHLQTNKVKYIMNNVRLIQSLDRLSLAGEIDSRAKKLGMVFPVLLEINIGSEESKSGLGTEDLKPFIEEISQFENICVKGLMTVAPYMEDPERVRPYFRRMKELFEASKGSGRKDFSMEYLSMGMSNDYEVAVEEGADMIRLGTALFGDRNYKLK